MGDWNTDLRKLSQFVEAARSIDSVLPTQALHTLLIIALKPGTNQSALMKETVLASASVSRNVAALGAVNRKGDRGYGLVASVPGRGAAKSFDIYLTTRGREAVRRLLTAATDQSAEAFCPPTVR